MLPALIAIFGSGGAFYLLLKLIWPTWYLDLSVLKTFSQVGNAFKAFTSKGVFLIDIFEEKAKEVPKKTFIIYNDEKYTYGYMDKMANKACRTAVEIGLKPGTIVAVLMNNEPGFIWTYLGLMKAGYQIALINFNLRSKSLAHCINVSKANVIIVGEGTQLAQNVEEILPNIPNIMVYYMGTIPGPKPAPFLSWDLVMSRTSDATIDRSLRKHLTLKSTHVFIYTSGTTGLPKPAIVPQIRALSTACSFKLFGMTSDDVLYEPLPMYHTVGLLMGLGGVIVHGATMVLKDRFSAKHFWEDCRKYDVTVIQYIGEVCRYLVSRPKSKEDGRHKIRVAMGNGLRQDIWEEFETRFKIPHIVEFYGSTEGPVGFINSTNKRGAVGISTPLMRRLMPTAFVKYDVEAAGPYRNKHGRCVHVGLGEVGLLIAPVIEGKTDFYGYHNNKKATEKKYMYDVFKDGDIFINTGDLMKVDRDYYVYFNDRVGDTFRWKGENVSTTEVSNMLTDLDFIQDANVYGVTVPGGDGRAGMVTVTLLDSNMSDLSPDMLQALSTHVREALPVYARPKFVRVRKELEMTSTFKQQKTALVKEGYDIAQIQDPVYYLNSATQAYQVLDEDAYSQILTRKIQF